MKLFINGWQVQFYIERIFKNSFYSSMSDFIICFFVLLKLVLVTIVGSHSLLAEFSSLPFKFWEIPKSCEVSKGEK